MKHPHRTRRQAGEEHRGRASARTRRRLAEAVAMSEDHDAAEQAEEGQAERLEAETAERLVRGEIGIDISQDRAGDR